MREIKFRTVCKSTKKVIAYEIFNSILNDGYLYTLESERGEDQICHTNYSDNPMPKPAVAIGGLVRYEFTGLQDSKGVDIYEGDILSNGMVNPKIGEVICRKGCFEIKAIKNFQFLFNNLSISSFEFKVIGNIYENPELLNE